MVARARPGGRPPAVSPPTADPPSSPTDPRSRGLGGDADFVAAVGRAYDRTGAAWDHGPARLYDRLADALVAESPVDLAGRTVLDVGAGTGAASLALAAAGARVVAVDLAPGMLRAYRTPASGCVGRVAAEATRLPVATGGVGGVVAAFSFNHLPDPGAGFREAARVGTRGAPVLVAAYAADDDHPAKQAVDAAAAAEGWQADAWYGALRAEVSAHLATVAGMRAAAAVDGLEGDAVVRRVDLPDLDPEAMVGWRMGMAQLAPFLAAAGPDVRRRVARGALERLGPHPPPVRRSIVVYRGVVTRR